jgi:hypothetical protein
MSAEVRNYRWSSKPVMATQSLFFVGAMLLVFILCFRFYSKMKKQSEVHAFTQAKSDHTATKTNEALAKSGSVPSGGLSKTPRYQVRGSVATNPRHQNVIQERPLFDGMTVTIEVATLQSVSSNSGDPSMDAQVVAAVAGDTSPPDMDGILGATLHGQFQPNFDTKRLHVVFRELVTQDNRHYPISGIGLDMDGEAIGVPGDYSSGMGLRILGATIGTVISTAETVGTSRIIENEAGQDALLGSQLNQAITTTTQGATTTISDEATHDLKNQKAVLSLPAGTHFRVKIRETTESRTGGSS